MALFGSVLLLAAFVASIWAVAASLLGGYSRSSGLVESGERAAITTWGLLILCAATVITAFLQDRFELRFVAGFSNRDMPWFYKLTALWAGQSGSLLLWVSVLATFVVVVILQNQRRNRVLMPYATATLMAIVAFFTVLLNFSSNPFETLRIVPPGVGIVHR